MGLDLFGDQRHKAPMITLVRCPDGVDEAAVRAPAPESTGSRSWRRSGRFQGKVWRIGPMGYNARLENALAVLAALERVLVDQGCGVGSGSRAAIDTHLGAVAV